jgi:uncharacterized repeat protein (TIGR04138 family)
MTVQLCQKCGRVPATQGVDHLMVCDDCAEVLRRANKGIQELFAWFSTRQEPIESIVAEDSRFSSEVYEFVAEAMGKALFEWYSKHRIRFDGSLIETQNDKETPVGKLADMKMPSERLVVALRRLASERFGKCAAATFNSWGVTRWQDFAEIVSRMQKAKISLFCFLVCRQEDFKSRGALDDVFPET